MKKKNTKLNKKQKKDETKPKTQIGFRGK